MQKKTPSPPSHHHTMAAQQQCLLDDIVLDPKEWIGEDMIQIENHILAGNCPKVHPPLKVIAKEKGGLGTFLLRACENGYLEGVKKIVEVWGVDINVTATHSLNPHDAACIGMNVPRLLGATPLFVAALENHIEVIRYLVTKGADVSAKTSVKNEGPFAGITPLHGALLCNYERNGISVDIRLKYVETIRVLLESGANPSALSSDGTPTWMFGMIRFYENGNPFCRQGHCEANAISHLVEHGISLSQLCSRLGRTLLHHMAGKANEFDNVKVVDLILEKGADPRVRDKHGITPIMSAAIGNNLVPNMFVLKFLMERDDIPNSDKIEALEVAAAVLISYRGGLVHTQDVDYCLSRSQNLRIIEGATSISKTPSVGRAVEWDPPVNLDYILQRPLEHKIQSILTRLRIFSSLSWGAVYRYLWPYIDSEYIDQLFRERQYVQMLDISWIMLETIRRFAPTSDATEISQVAEKVVGVLVKSLSGLKMNGDPFFNPDTLQTSLKLISSTFTAQCNRFDYTGDIGYYLCRLFFILVDEPVAVIESTGENLLQIVKMSESMIPSGKKLIHLACTLPYWQQEHTNETLLRIAPLLLKFGANPDSVDGKGNGPLHYLAKGNGGLIDEVARLLLASGAHFDRVNKGGLTAVDVWKEERAQVNKRRRLENQLAVGWEDLPEWLQETNVPRLLCLSARVIRSHRIPYLKKSPITLHPFIEMH